jgi:succinoglycan biosynthesis transport protein ExoP
MDPTSPDGRYQTLRDYLRVLRRYRVPIVVITVLGAVAGYLAAKTETPSYKASATVSIQDPQQNLALAGLTPGLGQQPLALATQSMETLTRPSLMLAVRRALHSREPVAALSSAVAGQVTAGGLLEITATTSDPALAPRLADTVATVLVSQNNRAAQALYRADASAVAREIARYPGGQTNAGLQTLQQQQARLATLSRVAQTSQLSQAATPPTSPSSPNTSRSALIGLALGLLVALAAAFLRDTLDRRLRTPQDVETSLHIPVLAHVRNQVMGKTAQIAAVAKKSYMPDVEAFRILRRNLELLGSDRPPRSILVTSTVAGEGKTTVASSLAVAMTIAGKRTLLVDCDLRRPALASRLGIEPSPGISEYLLGTASPEEVLRTVDVAGSRIASRNGTSGNGNSSNGTSSNGHAANGRGHPLVCIPAGSATAQAVELLGSRRFEEFIEQVSGTYDAVVLDSSPLLPVADTLEIVPHVDAVVVCVRESKTTRAQGDAARATLSRFPDRPAGIVITGVRERADGVGNYAYSHARD